MKNMLLGFATLTLLLTACQKDVGDKSKMFLGPVTQFQHGKAWTWMETDKAEVPKQIGIAIDDEAMASLNRPEGGDGQHQHGNGAQLSFHSKVLSSTPFKYVQLDWNPSGHEPEFIYGAPHFDFHYYTSTLAETQAIPPYQVDPTGFDNKPDAAYLPPTYIDPGGGVPQMGKHWLDATSPELSGQPFTQTFIYGTYNGKVTFLEPMITEAFLTSSHGFERSIPQPAKVQVSGHYPTKMRILKSQGYTSVILADFVYRQAS